MLKRYGLVLLLLLLVGSLLFQSTAQSQDPTAATTPTPTLIPGLPTEPYIIEAEDPIVIKEGEWDEFESTSASGNAYVASKRTGDQQLGLLFEGTRIEVIYARHEAFGTLSIEIDNEIVQTIDTQSDVAQFNVREVVNELESGFHIIRVIADRGAIAIDGFEITPTTDLETLQTVLPQRNIVDQAGIESSLNDDNVVGLIIQLEVPPGYVLPSQLPNNEARVKQIENLNLVRRTLVQELSDYEIHVLGGSMNWNFISGIVIEVDRDAYRRLLELPYILHISQADFGRLGIDVQNIDITPSSLFSSYQGAGQTVVILDGGIDNDHPYFGNRIVHEACFASENATEYDITSLCPPDNSVDECPNCVEEPNAAGVGAASLCSWSGDETLDQLTARACTHGTHVSGIAAGSSQDDPNAEQVGAISIAPSANIIAIRVMSAVDICSITPSDPCILDEFVYEVDLLRALNYILEIIDTGDLRDNNGNLLTLDISSINMSLSFARTDFPHSDFCDSDYPLLKQAIDELRANDVATVISTANPLWSTVGGGITPFNRQTSKIAAPSCISTAISVSGTDQSLSPEEIIGPFHISQFVDLVAPGVEIISSAWDNIYEPRTGTSQAAPQVTGAWAVIRGVHSTPTVNEVLWALRETGTPIIGRGAGNDMNNWQEGEVITYGGNEPFTWPRINVDCAIRWLDNPALASLSYTGYDGNGSSGSNGYVDISDDGRYIVFDSRATNLVANDTNLRRDVFVFDRHTCAVKRISQTDGGIEGDLDSAGPSISGDGRYIVYSSDATNLDPERPDNNNRTDIFLHDRDTDGDGIYDEPGDTRTQRITHPHGTEFDLGVNAASISEDGSTIVFSSDATNVVENDTNDDSDLFVYDRDSDRDQILDEPGATHFARVSVSSEGNETTDGHQFTTFSISGNGQHIVFASESDQGLVVDHISF